MASQQCGACQKTVYATEKVEAAQKWYHKGCFKCADPTCSIQLTLKTFQVVNDQIWCAKHAPQPKATAVPDAVSIMHAKHAPKKTAEGLHKTTVGTGETPTYGLDTVLTQHALNAPKKSVENLLKTQVGSGEFSYGLGAIGTQHALNAPRKGAENLGVVQKGGSRSEGRTESNGELNQGEEVVHEEIRV